MITHFPETVFMIGAGGIGVSGLAGILLSAGHRVFGTDLQKNENIEMLCEKGFRFIESPADIALPKPQLAVYSAAVPESDLFRTHFQKQGLKCVTYAAALGRLAESFPRSIAVTGTHGKTSTTAMVHSILSETDTPAAVLCGGILKSIGRNYDFEPGPCFVFESCEYDRSFLHHYPASAIITNIEADHLDVYKDLDDIRAAFQCFMNNVKPGGCIVMNSAIASLTADHAHPVRFGVKGDYVIAKGQWAHPRNCFELIHQDSGKTYALDLPFPGDHYIQNAAAAAALCLEMGVAPGAVQKGLAGYRGVERRFDILFSSENLVIIDDYAHHPTEIEKTLNSLRLYYPDFKIVLIFQAHQYSRTYHLLNEFKHCFGISDALIIPEIYEQRDTAADKKRISGKSFAKTIGAHHGNVYYIPRERIIREIWRHAGPKTVMATFGAGNIFLTGRELARAAAQK